MLAELVKSKRTAKYDLSSLYIIGSGAAALSPDVANTTSQKMNAMIVQGRTEAYVTLVHLQLS